MHIILILLVIAGGMGLSVEAGLLGPLGAEVGDLWAAFSIFSVGTGLTFLLMLFSAPQILIFCAAFMAPLGGVLGPVYVIILHHCHACDRHCHDDDRHSGRPGFKSLIIDHYGLLGTPHRRIDTKTHYCAGIFIAALILVAQG
ncbi:DMT family transporter [Enterobacter hormaechei]